MVNLPWNWSLKNANIKPIEGTKCNYYEIKEINGVQVMEVHFSPANEKTETVLIINLIAEAISYVARNDEVSEIVYACKVKWIKHKDDFYISPENEQEINVSIGSIDIDLIKRDNNYFFCLMKDLLDQDRVYKKCQRPDNSGAYIGSVMRDSSTKEPIKKFDERIEYSCGHSSELKNKQEQLNTTLEPDGKHR